MKAPQREAPSMGSDGTEGCCPHVPVSTTAWEQAPATESDLSSSDEDENPTKCWGERGNRGHQQLVLPTACRAPRRGRGDACRTVQLKTTGEGIT